MRHLSPRRSRGEKAGRGFRPSWEAAKVKRGMTTYLCPQPASESITWEDVCLVLERMDRRRFHTPGRGEHTGSVRTCAPCLELASHTVRELRSKMLRRGAIDLDAFASRAQVRGRMLDAERKIRVVKGQVSRPDQVSGAKCSERALEAAAARGELPCPVTTARKIYERVIAFVQYGLDLPEPGRVLPFGRIGRNLPGVGGDVPPHDVGRWWAAIRRALESDPKAAALLEKHVDSHTECCIGTDGLEDDRIGSGPIGGTDGALDAMTAAVRRAVEDSRLGMLAWAALPIAVDGEFGAGTGALMRAADPEAWSELVVEVSKTAALGRFRP